MKLNYIGTHVDEIPVSKFTDFIEWLLSARIVAHDIETNVTDSILDREIITIQYADKQTAWVIQWSYLTDEEKRIVKGFMGATNRKLIIHSATFEYTVWKKYGVVLRNVFDTYSTEQILNTGKGSEESSYNLESIIQKRFGITLTKEFQLTFGDNIMTYDKIKYAAGDVANGVELYEIQMSELKDFDRGFPQPNHKGLVKTTWWENEFALVAGDIEFNGMLLDPVKWTECYNISYPKMIESKSKLDEIVIQDFKHWAINNEFYSDKPRFDSIWGSSIKKQSLLQLIFPNIEKVSKVDLKEYLRDNDSLFPAGLKLSGKQWENSDYPYNMDDKYSVIKYLILLSDRNKDEILPTLNGFFYQNFKGFMIEKGYVIPENTLSINWASPAQKLTLFKHINPSIESTDAQTVEDNLLTHPLFRLYQEYQESASLVTKFGLDYLKHVQADGRIRTVFNRVLATGRLSAKSPNLLQLPRNEHYRAAFVAPKGWKIVDADYEAEELVFIALLSRENKWIEALEKEEDLHSINAEILYEDKWTAAIEEGCEFALHKHKCKCKGHKEMRTTSKTLSFGLSYGLSSYGFAARNHISEEESVRLINKFFDSFPNIRTFLSKCGMFGVGNNFIYEYGTGRVRFFDAWKTARRYSYHGGEEYVNEAEMRGVMRASSNFPIQALGASVLKVATVLLRRWIVNNNLWDRVQIALPVHDQILMYAKEDFAEETARMLEHYMQLAGRLVLKNTLLRAKASISDYWKKD